MKSKTVFSFVLLTFVAVSVVFALRKVTPDAATSQDQAAASSEAGIAATPVPNRHAAEPSAVAKRVLLVPLEPTNTQLW